MHVCPRGTVHHCTGLNRYDKWHDNNNDCCKHSLQNFTIITKTYYTNFFDDNDGQTLDQHSKERTTQETVTETECTSTSEEKCETAYEEQCTTVYEQQCSSVPGQLQCVTVNDQVGTCSSCW